MAQSHWRSGRQPDKPRRPDGVPILATSPTPVSPIASARMTLDKHQDIREVRVYDYADLNVPMLARMFDRRCHGGWRRHTVIWHVCDLLIHGVAFAHEMALCTPPQPTPHPSRSGW
jgi:hypothetical protein